MNMFDPVFAILLVTNFDTVSIPPPPLTPNACDKSLHLSTLGGIYGRVHFPIAGSYRYQFYNKLAILKPRICFKEIVSTVQAHRSSMTSSHDERCNQWRKFGLQPNRPKNNQPSKNQER